jgi:catechol 2,3-dioxygenase-like lactoylglutathione lyase family enzyme
MSCITAWWTTGSEVSFALRRRAILRRLSGMERVTGIGGIFFKANDPDQLQAWYQRHLGVEPGGEGVVKFEWREALQPEHKGHTVWAPFPKDTRYFDPSTAPFMINYRVSNLDRMLEQLRRAGAALEERIEESEYGRFGWVLDPEGNRIELWEPPAPKG